MELCNLCERIERTESRTVMVNLAADYLRRLDEASLPIAALMVIGEVFPAWDQRELDISTLTLLKVVKRLLKIGDEDFLKAFNETGDLGNTLMGLFKAKKPVKQYTLTPSSEALTVTDVYGFLVKMAEAKGLYSRRVKERLLEALFSRLTPLEAKYAAKLIVKERRYGFGENLLEEALTRAFNVPLEDVRRANMITSDIGLVAKTSMKYGVNGLRSLSITVFHPLKPMLAENVGSITEALKEHGYTTALEYKLDGARVQLHKRGGEIRIYSRHLKDITTSIPEVVSLTLNELNAESCIVEGEVVALGVDGRLRPFQYVMRRFRRVKDIQEMVKELPVKLYLFDVLYMNGKELIDEPYVKRRDLLEQVAGDIPLVKRLITGNVKEAEAFFKEALSIGCEGVMAKSLQSPYTPGVRGRRWLKVKATPLTLDLVIVAAEYGYGYRYKWLSNYTLAAYNPRTGAFEPVGKCFTGLRDDEIIYMTERLKALSIAKYGRTLIVKPEVVVEVGFAEVQRSPHYRAGYALRFPRILRVREDKGPFEADTIDKVRELYDIEFKAPTSAL